MDNNTFDPNPQTPSPEGSPPPGGFGGYPSVPPMTSSPPTVQPPVQSMGYQPFIPASPLGGYQVYPPTSVKKSHTGAALGSVAIIALFLLSGGIGVYVGHSVWTPATQVPSTTQSTGPAFGGNSSNGGGGTTPTSLTPGAAAPNSIISSVDAGLVDINTSLKYQNAAAAGTGMVLTSNGLILTNNHVIEGSTTLSATDINNGRTYSATVVGYDASQDVAVIQLQGASGLKTVSLGNSSSVRVGDSITGVGNAGGIGGAPSYAGGNVVALGQSITATDNGSAKVESLVNMIEINADIQPGDSGGPMIENGSGKVVGMDTAGSTSTGQFGGFPSNTGTVQAYAIPINTAVSLAKEMVAGKASSTIHIGSTAFMGVEVETASQAQTQSGCSTPGPATSVVIANVLTNTPAAQTALAACDTILAVNGQNVTSINQLGTFMQSLHAGNTVTVTYDNLNGTQETASFQLAAGPPQ